MRPQRTLTATSTATSSDCTCLRSRTALCPLWNTGLIRLWDSGVSWGLVEQHRGKYWWVGLDRAVAAATSQGAEILYVLGSTPTWAASNRKQGSYPNAGAASSPRHIADWRRWVTAVVRRHGASIYAYQVWNEANLPTFWQGTPRQMARLTLEAHKIIKRLDPTAKVVAASSTVRLSSAFNRFFPAYLKELRKVGWPVDVSPSTPTVPVRRPRRSAPLTSRGCVGSCETRTRRSVRCGTPRSTTASKVQAPRTRTRTSLARGRHLRVADLPRQRPSRHCANVLVFVVREN